MRKSFIVRIDQDVLEAFDKIAFKHSLSREALVRQLIGWCLLGEVTVVRGRVLGKSSG